MNIHNPIALVETILSPGHLNKTQQTVLEKCWEGESYTQIAKDIGYGYGYVKDVGAELWQLLSQTLEQKVTKHNVRGVLQHYAQHQGQSPEPSSSAISDCQGDEIIDTSIFYGRDSEIERLQTWVCQCRLVTVLGQGGMGKTALVTKVVRQVEPTFDGIFWRSLRNVPPLSELLQDMICSLSYEKQTTPLPYSIDGRISCLMTYLRQQRCLLVLDNLESTLRRCEWGGRYQGNCQDYGLLLRRVTDESHKSCVILTSRERPISLVSRGCNQHYVKVLKLPGLQPSSGQRLLATQQLNASVQDLQALIYKYGGNPLALKIAAVYIQSVYGGDVAAFLREGTVILGGIRDLLEQQFQRLSNVEQRIVLCLAGCRGGLTLAQLQADRGDIPPHYLIEALESLLGRSLIQRSQSGFMLQPLIRTYMNEQMGQATAVAVA